MPLVSDRELDSWNRLQGEGLDIVSPSTADRLEFPEIHIGFLNMMPDRAFRATERQFLRLLAMGSDECLIRIHPFTVSEQVRAANVQDYINRSYKSVSDVQSVRLDGLVLTGANPGESDLRAEDFWPGFEEVILWADESVPTILCSCLASHAVIDLFHGIQRTRCEPAKRWGVYSHRLVKSDHPLVTDMAFSFDTPRSHVFEMTSTQLERAGIEVLAFSHDADFDIAVSSDGFKWIFLQGHPEYDSVSLLKEFHREVVRFTSGERPDYPQYPLNYLNDAAKERLVRFRNDLLKALDDSVELPRFPESEILPSIVNTWRDNGRTLYRNWIRMIVRHVTARENRQSFRESA